MSEYINSEKEKAAKPKSRGVLKNVPELQIAFSRSQNKAKDLRILYDRLDDQYKALLREWLTQ